MTDYIPGPAKYQQQHLGLRAKAGSLMPGKEGAQSCWGWGGHDSEMHLPHPTFLLITESWLVAAAPR